jgi:hypothetical protein
MYSIFKICIDNALFRKHISTKFISIQYCRYELDINFYSQDPDTGKTVLSPPCFWGRSSALVAIRLCTLYHTLYSI